MSRASEKQVAGNHYKKLTFQPDELFEICPELVNKQTSIIRYASRYRDKNGREDLMKAIHYCELGEEYTLGRYHRCPDSTRVAIIVFCRVNGFDKDIRDIMLLAAEKKYTKCRETIEHVVSMIYDESNSPTVG